VTSRSTFSALAVAVGFALAGCTSTGYIEGGDAEPGLVTCGDVVTEVVDRGAQMDGIEPGETVGFFIEYSGDGQWQVTATCDTATSGFACFWDAIVGAEDGVGEPREVDLESDDELARHAGDGLGFWAHTGEDPDGFDFSATPGEPVEFDVFLDGACHPELVFWIGDGETHKGAASNPVWLEPSEP
jgi:hypothetical protein